MLTVPVSIFVLIPRIISVILLRKYDPIYPDIHKANLAVSRDKSFNTTVDASPTRMKTSLQMIRPINFLRQYTIIFSSSKHFVAFQNSSSVHQQNKDKVAVYSAIFFCERLVYHCLLNYPVNHFDNVQKPVYKLFQLNCLHANLDSES